MSPPHSKQRIRPIAFVCLAVVAAYLSAYLVLRRASTDSNLWAPASPTIFFGVFDSDTQFLWDSSPGLSRADEERKQQQIEKRAKLLGKLYAPVIALDRKMTGQDFFVLNADE